MGNSISRTHATHETRRSARRTAARAAFAASAVGVALFCTSAARATDVTEFPDNGSEQMGRGGAWVARASDPLAVFYNPAGLAGQETRVTLQANLSFQSTCFTRVKALGDRTIADGATPGGTYPQACNGAGLSPDPQLAMTFRVNDRIGIGFAPLMAPSAANGNASWPDGPPNGDPKLSPQRYMLTKSNLVLITPTIGAGFEVVDNLRLGASFQWGIASFKFSNVSWGVNGSDLDPKVNDVTAELSGHDYFIPGFTLGGIWSATDNFDVAAWYKWSAPVNATGDAKTSTAGKGRTIVTGDSALPDCGTGQATRVCGGGNNASIELARPMEAKIGFRFHKPLAGVVTKHKRDPIAQDRFDAEVDLTWANNSVSDNLKIRFPGDANGEGIIPINGTPGFAPPIADVKHHYKDVVGVRLGGDYNAMPDKLALRAGGFFETKGQDMTYQNVDIAGAARFGFAIGATYRVHVGSPEKTKAIELHVGLMHVFFVDEDNNHADGPGLAALAGTNCNSPGGNGEPPSTAPNCANGVQKFRTNWPINLGTITNSINVINVGASYRF